MISNYRNRFPNVTFDLKLGRPSRILSRVAYGDLDFALVDSFPTREQYAKDDGPFSIKPLIAEEVVLACSDTYANTWFKNNERFENMVQQRFISQEPEAAVLNNWFRHHYGKTKQNLNIVLNVANHQASHGPWHHRIAPGLAGDPGQRHHCHQSVTNPGRQPDLHGPSS